MTAVERNKIHSRYRAISCVFVRFLIVYHQSIQRCGRVWECRDQRILLPSLSVLPRSTTRLNIYSCTTPEDPPNNKYPCIISPVSYVMAGAPWSAREIITEAACN